jgi:hypothetical protein
VADVEAKTVGTQIDRSKHIQNTRVRDKKMKILRHVVTDRGKAEPMFADCFLCKRTPATRKTRYPSVTCCFPEKCTP